MVTKREVPQAGQAGIFIDDAGTPGAESHSAFLHSSRKSWAAVIIPESSSRNISHASKMFLAWIKQDFRAEELHFTDIYGGRREFKDVPIERRFELLELVTRMFAKFQLPIFFQTLSDEFLAELKKRGLFKGLVGYLDLENHQHLSLLFLLFQVRNFMSHNSRHFPDPLPVIIDEGLVKAGTTLQLPGFDRWFRGGRILHSRSHETPFLQLADFAAFMIARSQWLMAKKELKFRDKEFLRIVSGLEGNVMNLPMVPVDVEQHSSDVYDSILVADRRAKGLDDFPEDLN